MQLLKIDYDENSSELGLQVKENVIAVTFWTEEDVDEDSPEIAWDMSSLRHRHEKEKLTSGMIGINGKRQGLASAIRYPPIPPQLTAHVRYGTEDYLQIGELDKATESVQLYRRDRVACFTFHYRTEGISPSSASFELLITVRLASKEKRICLRRYARPLCFPNGKEETFRRKRRGSHSKWSRIGEFGKAGVLCQNLKGAPAARAGIGGPRTSWVQN
jgi:hypothetical protein